MLSAYTQVTDDYWTLLKRALTSWKETIMARPKLIDDWNGDIELVILPHNEQRYDTAGDWSFTTYFPHDPKLGSTLTFSISDTGDKRMNLCLFIHELNEALLFMGKHGFTRDSVEVVDLWDKEFMESSNAEPGEDFEAPYFVEHMAAMTSEQLAAVHFGVDWNSYTDAIAELDYTPPPTEEPTK